MSLRSWIQNYLGLDALTREREEMYRELSQRDRLVLQLESDLARARQQEEFYRGILLTRLGLIAPEAAPQGEVSPTPHPIQLRRKTIAQILYEMEADHRRKAAEKAKEATKNEETVNT